MAKSIWRLWRQLETGCCPARKIRLLYECSGGNSRGVGHSVSGPALFWAAVVVWLIHSAHLSEASKSDHSAAAHLPELSFAISLTAKESWAHEAKDMKDDAPQSSEADDVDPEEIEAASDETPTDVTAPEVDTGTKELVVWDEAPGSSGSATPTVRPDDEAPIGERLVYEGTDEADRERRMAAADPDFEP